jgi:hypothetical protein
MQATAHKNYLFLKYLYTGSLTLVENEKLGFISLLMKG